MPCLAAPGPRLDSDGVTVGVGPALSTDLPLGKPVRVTRATCRVTSFKLPCGRRRPSNLQPELAEVQIHWQLNCSRAATAGPRPDWAEKFELAAPGPRARTGPYCRLRNLSLTRDSVNLKSTVSISTGIMMVATSRTVTGSRDCQVSARHGLAAASAGRHAMMCRRAAGVGPSLTDLDVAEENHSTA